MKKILFLSVFLLMGCNNDVNITSINEVESNGLSEYKQSYLGNNSAVSQIVNSLPGGETYRDISLTNDSLKVVYGVKNNDSISEDTFSDFWLNDDKIKKNFIYNSVALFVLIKNVDKVTLEVDSNEYYSTTFVKKDLEKFLPHPFTDYKANDKLWKKEIVKEIVNSKNKREQIYKAFSAE